MITNTPLQLSVLWASILSWINISSPLILFGLYYGFLTTLPIGPSQILCVRAFLLEGDLSGTVAISGLILGQLIIFLLIYYSPLYILLVKPHTVTLLVLPYILFYWYRIKDLLDYQSLRPISSMKDLRIYKIFFDSFIFQLLNPVLLPSPVLARLINLFFFRYSNNFLFVLSCFFGWSSGHLFFFNSLKLLLIRIEQDSPVLYLLVKRLIYRTFSIIILACFLLYLGRAPVPLFTKKLTNELQFTQWKTYGFSWLNKPWPTFFFDYSRWNRPLRYIENSRFSNKSPVKKNVSQYFFDISLSDGKQKISFTALPSLSVFEKDLKNYLNISKKFNLSNNLYKDWINIKKKRKYNLDYELKNRVKALDNGFLMEEIIEKKTGLSNNEGNNLTKIYDPFLSGSFRGKTIISKSPWLLTKKFYELKKDKKIVYLAKKENKLKFWISNRWRELERKSLPLPWEPLNKNARRILISLIQRSKNKKLETKLQQINFSEEQTFFNLNKQSNFSDIAGKLNNIHFLNKKLTRISHFNWELVLNLSSRQRALYFKELEQEKWQVLEHSWKNLFSNNSNNFTQLNKILFLLKKIFYFHKKFPLQEISKEIPRWTSKLRNDKFDVIAIGVTDIRQRKVKNLGYLIKGKEKRRKIVRRFSQQSDFRRKLVKGSMRARRRKTLIWKILQLKTHSPFFLRINEKHISFQFSLNRLNLIYIKNIFKNPLEKRKKIILFSTKKDDVTIRRTKAERLAIANRWDFPLAQWGRSWLLIIQSHFRKYLVLPVLIIFKNIIRLILFQTPEWNEDWNEWNKEIYIKCTYDGIEVSEKELPEQWLRDGLQIKIIYPFNLRPWHNVQLEIGKEKNRYKNFNSLDDEKTISNNLLKNNQNFSKNIKNKKINYSYLTAWGFETTAPFGDIKKKPSFWKPINKKLRKKWKKNILLKFNKFYFNFFLMKKKKSINSISNESKNLIKSNTKIKNNSEFDSNNKNHNENFSEQITFKFSKNILPESLIKNKYRISKNRKNLEKLKYLKKYKIEKITKKNYFDKIKFSNSLENKNKIYFSNKIKIIEIKQKIIKYCKKNIELIKKGPYLIKINFYKINKNCFKFYIYFIRFTINLIIKIKQNFTFIKNGRIWNLLKFSQIKHKKEKIDYEYLNNSNKTIENLKIKFNQETIFLMSQAYLFHKISQAEILNKYKFNYLLKNWTSDLIIKKKIKRNLKKKGILSLIELKVLEEKNWKKCLQIFNKYNLSSQIWYRIAAQEWRNQITHQSKERGRKNFNISEKQTKAIVLSKQKKKIYKLAINSLLEENKKLNKRYKYNYLCYSYLDFKKKADFLELTKNKEKKIFNNETSQLFKNQINKKNISIKSNLILWLIPTLAEKGKKNIVKLEKKAITSTSLLKDKNKKNIQNKKSLRERERHQIIRQWKWKSKNVEKNFKELGDMASLMTFMQDQENSISLSTKMREHLDLFRLLFCRDIGINKLTINSEHRLSRVLDDQILMYKVVSLFLKSKARLKKNLDIKHFNESTLRIDIFQNNKKNNFNLLNLEDIMLLKHRKELKVLNLLYLNKNPNKILDFNKAISEKNRRTRVELNKIQNENPNLTIKHFLWPSFRLEDLACVNRFWFNTNNGSRFTMLRIRMYT
uniref:Ycf1 protein n=1 Tax=Encalypta ciliata TaxID=130446 RepID=UPI00286B7601|nr:Ycf1 protein [Encalypta ciliata]UVG41351.1 Ycf1 protein [Encalypta ciliata]